MFYFTDYIKYTAIDCRNYLSQFRKKQKHYQITWKKGLYPIHL